MKIFKEEAGLIDEEEIWVCIHEEYMYTGKTLEDLANEMNAEWEHPKHLVG